MNLVEFSKTRPVNFELANATKSEINFELFASKYPDGVFLSEASIRNSGIDINVPTKIFIHGWKSHLKDEWYGAFRDEYLKKGGHNIICVDWYEAGNKDYAVAAANVKPVGHYIGDFIVASKVRLERIHLIAKSLGAHVASYTGKQVQEVTGNKIGRITALDPVGPKFETDEIPENQRLNKTDAEFVDVVHTDSGYYGFKSAVGTVDFYPNGGEIQPGCDNDEAGHSESHDRAIWYFLESINFTSLKIRKTNTWNDFLEGKFIDEDSIVFGEEVPKSANGIYFFKTNPTPPYIADYQNAF